MGEHADAAVHYFMTCGYRDTKRKRINKNLYVVKCPFCETKTRAVGWDKLAGLRDHIKMKHSNHTKEGE